MNNLLSSISNSIVQTISASGYTGVAILMAIESAAIPLPSEVIMPFAGFMVAQGRFGLWGIALAGAIGSTVGSLVLYAIGYFGGRPLIEKYGKYILIDHKDLERADKFFIKYGSLSNFIGRLLPIVRTFISFPAGVAESPLKNFTLSSLFGSFIWSLFLGWIGYKLGQNWGTLHSYFRNLDIILAIAIIAGLVWYITKHIRHRIR